MVRYRAICIVKYGQFREFLSACEELNSVCLARGWKTATFYAPVVGHGNEFVAECDYPDLATFERETQAQMTDPEYMKIFRGNAERIYPQTARDEVLQTVTHIA